LRIKSRRLAAAAAVFTTLVLLGVLIPANASNAAPAPAAVAADPTVTPTPSPTPSPPSDDSDDSDDSQDDGLPGWTGELATFTETAIASAAAGRVTKFVASDFRPDVVHEVTSRSLLDKILGVTDPEFSEMALEQGLGGLSYLPGLAQTFKVASDSQNSMLDVVETLPGPGVAIDILHASQTGNGWDIADAVLSLVTWSLFTLSVLVPEAGIAGFVFYFAQVIVDVVRNLTGFDADDGAAGSRSGNPQPIIDAVTDAWNEQETKMIISSVIPRVFGALKPIFQKSQQQIRWNALIAESLVDDNGARDGTPASVLEDEKWTIRDAAEENLTSLWQGFRTGAKAAIGKLIAPYAQSIGNTTFNGAIQDASDTVNNSSFCGSDGGVCYWIGNTPSNPRPVTTDTPAVTDEINDASLLYFQPIVVPDSAPPVNRVLPWTFTSPMSSGIGAVNPATVDRGATFTGTGVAGTDVAVVSGRHIVCATTVNTYGYWRCTPSSGALAGGTNTTLELWPTTGTPTGTEPINGPFTSVHYSTTDIAARLSFDPIKSVPAGTATVTLTGTMLRGKVFYKLPSEAPVAYRTVPTNPDGSFSITVPVDFRESGSHVIDFETYGPDEFGADQSTTTTVSVPVIGNYDGTVPLAPPAQTPPAVTINGWTPGPGRGASINQGSNCLSFPGGGTRIPGTPVVLGACPIIGADMWTITNSARIETWGGCLTVGRLNYVLEWDACSATDPHQLWEVQPNGTIMNPSASACIHSNGVGAQLDLDNCAPDSTQVWDVQAFPGPIVSANNLCIDLQRDANGHSVSSGNSFTVAGCDITSQPQGFFVRHGEIEDGYGCLTYVPGQLIENKPCTGDPSQLWTHTDVGTLVNTLSKLCLENPNNAPAGTQLTADTCDTHLDQKWSLEEQTSDPTLTPADMPPTSRDLPWSFTSPTSSAPGAPAPAVVDRATTITGTGRADTAIAIRVRNAGVRVCVTETDDDGNWSCTPTKMPGALVNDTLDLYEISSDFDPTPTSDVHASAPYNTTDIAMHVTFDPPAAVTAGAASVVITGHSTSANYVLSKGHSQSSGYWRPVSLNSDGSFSVTVPVDSTEVGPHQIDFQYYGPDEYGASGTITTTVSVPVIGN
jgi:hypothetical protein